MSSPRLTPTVGATVLGRTLEDAQALGAELYYPHRLTPLAPPASFAFSVRAARLGPVTVGVLRYSSGIRIDTGPYVTAVQVNIPLQGSVRTSIGGEHVRATNARAALYPHDVPTAISGWDQPCAMLAIKLDRAMVERRIAAEGAHGFDIHGTPTLDVSTGVAAAWIAAMRDIIATAQRIPDLDPGLVAYLADRCVDGFVLSALGDGRTSEEHVRTADAAIVDRALEAITYASGPPLSLTMLSDYVGVSARSIQSAFRRARAETPMQAQRRERLRRARRDLRRASAPDDLVKSIALRHGFTHLGRFSADYHREYGELPSHTLDR
ncbi:MAG TPA: helix-turn-helix domain-containing protein [Microbacterium sp.]|nr:helix-turn-helix domain-containing protein [Microbacterium sp.]